MGLFYNPYGHHQRPCGTTTFPRTSRLHFLSIRKDTGLNTNCNLCNENQLDTLFIIYFTKKPLHVSGVFIANNQEVFTVYVQQ
jgi:hypothetical protein